MTIPCPRTGPTPPPRSTRAIRRHRVLEVPGSPFATYQWGNTVDSVLVGLADRPQLVREVQPYGSPASALLLDAIDRRVQEGIFESTSLVPLARLFGIGDVLVRSDLATERAGAPDPVQVWAGFTDPPAPGLGTPTTFGEPAPHEPVPGVDRLDESDLASDAPTEEPPPVAAFPVEDPVAIVRTGAAARPVLLGGDGDGVVDSAAAGLLDGDAAVFEVAALDDAALASVVGGGADLVLTDTNRRRIQTWFYAIRDTRGPTEQAGETLPEPTGYDFRLDPFDHSGDDSHTVVEQVGGHVTANGGGDAARPEDRAVAAADGDLRTSWRAGGADPTGLRLSLVADEPQRTDHLTLVQPLDGPRDRAIERIQVSFDSARPFDIVLGPESLTPEGQTIVFPTREITRVDIRVTDVTTPPFDPALANAVGFAEVRLGDVEVHEQVRLPVDLLERASSSGNRLDVVLTRLRRDPADRGRLDEELALVRVFTLPEARTFGLGGTIRLDQNAADPVLDEVLGTDLGGGAAEASSHLAGETRGLARLARWTAIPPPRGSPRSSGRKGSSSASRCRPAPTGRRCRPCSSPTAATRCPPTSGSRPTVSTSARSTSRRRRDPPWRSTFPPRRPAPGWWSCRSPRRRGSPRSRATPTRSRRCRSPSRPCPAPACRSPSTGCRRSTSVARCSRSTVNPSRCGPSVRSMPPATAGHSSPATARWCSGRGSTRCAAPSASMPASTSTGSC